MDKNTLRLMILFTVTFACLFLTAVFLAVFILEIKQEEVSCSAIQLEELRYEDFAPAKNWGFILDHDSDWRPFTEFSPTFIAIPDVNYSSSLAPALVASHTEIFPYIIYNYDPYQNDVIQTFNYLLNSLDRYYQDGVILLIILKKSLPKVDQARLLKVSSLLSRSRLPILFLVLNGQATDLLVPNVLALSGDKLCINRRPIEIYDSLKSPPLTSDTSSAPNETAVYGFRALNLEAADRIAQGQVDLFAFSFITATRGLQVDRDFTHIWYSTETKYKLALDRFPLHEFDFTVPVESQIKHFYCTVKPFVAQRTPIVLSVNAANRGHRDVVLKAAELVTNLFGHQPLIRISSNAWNPELQNALSEFVLIRQILSTERDTPISNNFFAEELSVGRAGRLELLSLERETFRLQRPQPDSRSSKRTQATTEITSYRVKSGDTMFSVARAHGLVTADELMQLQPKSFPADELQVGQMLVLPGDIYSSSVDFCPQ